MFMKKLLVLFGVCIGSQLAFAQIPNAGFENVNPNGSIKNWGDLILIGIALDSNGVPTDTLVIDQQFYFSSTDAHSGTRALEMRNAYWTVSGGKIAGRAKLSSNDSDYTFFSAPVGIGQVPQNFSFYYKFLPANNDTAYAWMRLTDSSANVVGEAEIFVSGNHSSYTFISTPVVYTSTIAPAFVEMGFTTAKPLSQANFGTRFLVDDVSLSNLATGIGEEVTFEQLSLFPNPAKEQLTVSLPEKENGVAAQLRILSLGGQLVREQTLVPDKNVLRVNVEALPTGCYLLELRQNGKRYQGKFIR